MAQAATKTVETPTQTGNTKPLSEKAQKYMGKMTELMTKHKNVSGVIRALSAEGISRGEISKITGKRYQHVRNVLITPLTAKK